MIFQSIVQLSFNAICSKSSTILAMYMWPKPPRHVVFLPPIFVVSAELSMNHFLRNSRAKSAARKSSKL